MVKLDFFFTILPYLVHLQVQVQVRSDLMTGEVPLMPNIPLSIKLIKEHVGDIWSVTFFMLFSHLVHLHVQQLHLQVTPTDD